MPSKSDHAFYEGAGLVENVHEADELEDICDCNLGLRVRYVALVQLV
jgi:hypothetical protein